MGETNGNSNFDLETRGMKVLNRLADTVAVQLLYLQ